MLLSRSNPIVPTVRLGRLPVVAFCQRASPPGGKTPATDHPSTFPGRGIIVSAAAHDRLASFILQPIVGPPQSTFWLRRLFLIGLSHHLATTFPIETTARDGKPVCPERQEG